MKYPLGICESPEKAASLPVEAFDFLEVNVQSFLVPDRPDSDFRPLREAAAGAVRPVLSANCFLPGDLKCVGNAIDWDRLLAYAGTAFRRANEIGITTVVFGSGAARNAPDGCEKDRAMDDYVSVLKRIAPLAADSSVTLVVEPLNSSECNLVTSLREGAEAVERCDHPAVRLLADSYHMMTENEPATEIVRFGKWIHHVHFAELQGRSYPGKNRENFRPWFDALDEIEYRGRIALECKWDEPATDLPKSAQYLEEESAGRI